MGKKFTIELDLDKDFVEKLDELKEKYGEKFQKLNGFHNSNLNFTDFIDNFVDTDTTADTTIDPNANSSSHDIVSLVSEMTKPHEKLLSFNKLFYELKKKYGVETAKEWLEMEYNGNFYMHDAPSMSQKPYCILPEECCTFILNGKYIHTSLEDIYNLVQCDEYYDYQQQVHFKRPVNLKVLDYDKEKREKRYTNVIMISKKETDKDFYFTKIYNGCNIITTQDHKFIGVSDDIKAQNLIPHKTNLFSTFDDNMFTNSIYEYYGIPLNEDFGWLIGMYLAEGYNQSGQLSICQDKEKSPKEWNKIVEILNKYEIPYTLYKNGNVIRLKNGNNNWERKMAKIFKGKYCDQKRLCEDYIHFNETFLKGLLSGIIDGDGTVSKNKVLMIRMTSRTLINQIRNIGLHFGVYLGSRLPYIQSQKAKIQQKRPMYSANVNMNRNKDFFLSLPCIKIKDEFYDFNYDEKFANKNYECKLGILKVRDCEKTYKPKSIVYDLSTESHSFVCNEILIHNCYAYDLEDLVQRGLWFVDKFQASPAQHLDTFNSHVLEFVSWVDKRLPFYTFSISLMGSLNYNG